MYYREVYGCYGTVYDTILELIMSIVDICVKSDIQIWQLEAVCNLEEQQQRNNTDIHPCRSGL
mgnify:CR=1 FL=1